MRLAVRSELLGAAPGPPRKLGILEPVLEAPEGLAVHAVGEDGRRGQLVTLQRLAAEPEHRLDGLIPRGAAEAVHVAHAIHEHARWQPHFAEKGLGPIRGSLVVIGLLLTALRCG